MSFLAPWWIALAAAAAVPLLLHLLRRRSAVRTEFPAARYLQRAEREHSRSLRLRNLLLMLLRVAIVVLLALAAARPLAPSWGLPGGRAPTALAIVLDNSMSSTVVLDGRPLLEMLRDSARVALDGALPADRVWLVSADARLHGGTTATARAALDSLGPLHGAGDLTAALRRGASAVTDAAGFAPRIALFTDGQRTTWTGPVSVARDVAVFVGVPAGALPANRGVTLAAARPVRWMPRGTVAIGVHAPDSIAFIVALQSRGTAARTIGRSTAAPGEETAFPVSPSDTGWLAGFVDIEGDELPSDDRRYFAAWSGAAPRATAALGSGPFVRSALDVLRGESRIRDGSDIRFATATELVAGAAANFVTPPASAADLGAANQALARHGIPWRFGPSRGPGRITAPSSLAGATVHAAHELIPVGGPTVDTVAMLGDRPWAVAGSAGGARYVLVASPLLPEATDLPVRASFVPWIAAVVQERLAGGEGTVVEATPGSLVPRPAWADSLQLADGTTRALDAREFTAPVAPGVHFFLRAGRRAGALVVNAEENESVLERMGQDELAALLRGPRVATLSTTPGWRRALFARDAARSLVMPLLAAALALLLVEFAVTLRTRGAA